MVAGSIVNMLNFRIAQEELSSRMYKAMSVWLTMNGYLGAGKLWSQYATEELEHAQWAYDYLLAVNIAPMIQNIPQPDSSFTSLRQIVAISYKHELEVTKQCQELANACQQEGDYMTLTLAQKYLTEQVDEIDKLSNMVSKLAAFGDGGASLQLFDNQLMTLADGK
jgi:ferritin